MIKIFEEFNMGNKRKVGDYILISGKQFAHGRDLPGKITREFDWGGYVFSHEDGSYNVIEDKQILRNLSIEEIEEFEIESSIKKYNL